ncbi:ribonuclease H-like domain-containing protein [Tanacetum coccineum]
MQSNYQGLLIRPPDYVCHLQRSLYGLKQAPRAWFQRFASFITRVGFQHSKTDTSLFVYHMGSDVAFALYVDDSILTARLLLSDSALLHLLIRINSWSALHAAFLEVALQYLTFTRPDISYAVQQICLYMHDPRDPHFSALKRILRYVYLRVLFASLVDNPFVLVCKRHGLHCLRSCAEAEYRWCAKLLLWDCVVDWNLLLELLTLSLLLLLSNYDNVSAVYLSTYSCAASAY